MQRADYLLRVKDNRSKRKQDLEGGFVDGVRQAFVGMQMTLPQTVHQTNGRAVSDPLAFEHDRHYDGWTDLNSIVGVQRERRTQQQVSDDTAYYISSLPAVSAWRAYRLRACLGRR